MTQCPNRQLADRIINIQGREGKGCCVYFVMVNLFPPHSYLPLTLNLQQCAQPQIFVYDPRYRLAIGSVLINTKQAFSVS